MTTEKAIELLRGMQNKKVDYAEMVCAPAFAYGYEYVYPEPEDYAIEEAVKALKEIQQYREIGTVEECREAREKQIPKAPIMKPYYEDMPDEEYLCCPTCGDILTDRIPDDNKNFYFHCLNCGQKFDWREEDTK